jgi:geranylgeranyl pyrophosphate synthase
MIWQNRVLRLLRKEIEEVLVVVPVSGSLNNLVREPLQQKRRGLDPVGWKDTPWPVLPLMVCMSISGRYKRCLPAAAAFQFFQAAADVFDDIEDADSSHSLCSKYGTAAAVSTATTLLVLAEYSLARLKNTGIPSHLTAIISENVNLSYITACAGQHLDITIEKKLMTEDMYLKIAAMKTASQVRSACYTASMLAGADDATSAVFAAFGENLGMASQLTNDIQGIIRGTDIVRAKVTLPVIYALAVSEGESRSQLEANFFSPHIGTVNPDIIKDILYKTGAVHYASVKTEYYRDLALDSLAAAEKLSCKVERLHVFLQ